MLSFIYFFSPLAERTTTGRRTSPRSTNPMTTRRRRARSSGTAGRRHAIVSPTPAFSRTSSLDRRSTMWRPPARSATRTPTHRRPSGVSSSTSHPPNRWVLFPVFTYSQNIPVLSLGLGKLDKSGRRTGRLWIFIWNYVGLTLRKDIT